MTTAILILVALMCIPLLLVVVAVAALAVDVIGERVRAGVASWWRSLPRLERGRPALRHESDDCAGWWEFRDHERIQCDRCGASAPWTPQTESAATAENGLARVLEDQTRLGAAVLERERKGRAS